MRDTEPFSFSFRGAGGGGAERCLKTENSTLVAESLEGAADARVWSAEVSAVGLDEDGRGCCGIGERPLDAVQGVEAKKVVCFQDPDDDDMVGWITRASHSFDDGAFISLPPYASPSHSHRDISLPAGGGGERSERVEPQNSAHGKGHKASVVQFDLTTTQASLTATINATAPPSTTSPTGGTPLAAAQGAAEGSADVLTPKGAPPKNTDALSDTNSNTDSDVQVLDVSGCSLGAQTWQVEDAVSVSLSMPASHPPAPPSGRTVASLITTPARQREEKAESGWVSANAHVVPGSGSRSVAGDSSLKLSTPASALRYMSLSVYAQRVYVCVRVCVRMRRFSESHV